MISLFLIMHSWSLILFLSRILLWRWRLLQILFWRWFNWGSGSHRHAFGFRLRWILLETFLLNGWDSVFRHTLHFLRRLNIPSFILVIIRRWNLIILKVLNAINSIGLAESFFSCFTIDNPFRGHFIQQFSSIQASIWWSNSLKFVVAQHFRFRNLILVVSNRLVGLSLF